VAVLLHVKDEDAVATIFLAAENIVTQTFYFFITARKNTPIEEPEPDNEPAPIEEPVEPSDPGPAEDPQEQPVEGLTFRNLHPVPPAVGKYEQMPGPRIQLHYTGYQTVQPVEAPPHVARPRAQDTTITAAVAGGT
jgi:hypothetical protein